MYEHSVIKSENERRCSLDVMKLEIHRTYFHCITTWPLHALLGEIWQCICLFCCFVFTSQMVLLFNINFYFDCKIRLCLIVPGRHEKIYFCTRKFLSTLILNDINEQETSFLDCKHKHMMKCGAPPDKYGVHVPHVYL